MASALLPSMTFDGHLADAKMQVENSGFLSQLWEPEFGWDVKEVEASEAPHLPQLLTAFQCFLAFFVSSTQKVWVHLAAEMQAGKTGVVTALIRLVLSNAKKLNTRPTRIFVLTGMNDNAWKKQTRDRLPLGSLRDNVHHSSSLTKVVAALKCLTEMSAEKKLSNILIILDESHIASASGNRPNKLIYEAIRELCPIEEWSARGIRFLTISATDPARVLMMADEANEVSSQVVRLLTGENYQSVEKLYESGRIRFAEETGDLHERSTTEKERDELPSAIKEVQRVIAECYSDRPRYHLVRTRYGKQAEVMGFLRRAFPEAIIQPWDSDSRIKKTAEDGSCLSDMEDINELLEQPPAEHTFIVLKNMFYAAKTMKDEHVGVLYDRIGGKDDTNLQSLLGRACGYGRSEDSINYTSRQTVSNYMGFWREVSANPNFPPELHGVPVSKLDRKMTGVRVTHGEGQKAVLKVTSKMASPGTAGCAAAGGGGEPEPVREKANEDDFISEWKEFATFAEAKVWAKGIHSPKDIGGFFQTSTSKGPATLRYDEVMVMKGGKKTANLPWKALKVGGKSVHRLYVGYKDTTDPKSAIFIVRRLTRIA